MPTTTPVLLRALVDDAAVFPPGNAPLDQAVARHADHLGAWYAGCIGPLLVPPASVADLVRVLDHRDAAGPAGPAGAREPVDLVLVARPGADPATLMAARSALGEDGRVRVVGLELGWYDGWRDDLDGSLPLAVEIPRGPDGEQALGQVRTARGTGLAVVAKFRTGPTGTWPWPDETELASFLLMVAPEVPFKLTGGLHHAVRGTYAVAGVREENHGLLNVLVATSAALADAGQDEVEALLAVREAAALADLVAAWPDDSATRVREAFTAYGCCTVTDPVGELADLGLLARP